MIIDFYFVLKLIELTEDRILGDRNLIEIKRVPVNLVESFGLRDVSNDATIFFIFKINQ